MAVRSSLERQGFLVLEVARRDGSPAVSLKLSSARKKIKSQEFLIFNCELLAMLKAGLPVLQIFDLLIEQVGAGALHDSLVAVRQDIRGGSAAADAFAKYPGFFSGLYAASVRAGEQSGNLTGVLARYISYLKLMIELRQKVMKALAYSAFLLIVGFGCRGIVIGLRHAGLCERVWRVSGTVAEPDASVDRCDPRRPGEYRLADRVYDRRHSPVPLLVSGRQNGCRQEHSTTADAGKRLDPS